MCTDVRYAHAAHSQVCAHAAYCRYMRTLHEVDDEETTFLAFQRIDWPSVDSSWVQKLDRFFTALGMLKRSVVERDIIYTVCSS